MATVQITKSDGSVLDWKVTEAQADELIAALFRPAKRTYSRENSANWKRRGPKPKISIDSEVLAQALQMRSTGMGKEEIARELKIPSRSLGRAFDRYDSGSESPAQP